MSLTKFVSLGQEIYNMLLERSKQNENSVFKKSINLDGDTKYADKQDKLLAKDLAVITKDARRTSRVMNAEQRNIIRRSTSVQVTGQSGSKNKEEPVTPRPAMLYGTENSFTPITNTRTSQSTSHNCPDYADVRSHHNRMGDVHSNKTSSYSDNMMGDLRSIASKALCEIENAAKGQGRERSGSWGVIHRVTQKEKRINRADFILEKNISKWHTAFQRTFSGPSYLGGSRVTLDVEQANRSNSCNLPRLNSGSSITTIKSDSALQTKKKYKIYLPRID